MKVSNVELKKLKKGYILRIYENLDDKNTLSSQELTLTEKELLILQSIMESDRIFL